MVEVTFDWGLLAPGQTSVILDLTSVVPANWAYFVTTIGPFPKDTFGFGVGSNFEGLTSALIFGNNTFVDPIQVGVMRYKITMFDPRKLR